MESKSQFVLKPNCPDMLVQYNLTTKGTESNCNSTYNHHCNKDGILYDRYLSFLITAVCQIIIIEEYHFKVMNSIRVLKNVAFD